MSTDNQKLLKENNLNPFETNKLYEFWINSEYALLPPKIIEQMINVVQFVYNIEGRGLQQFFPFRTLANDIHWAPMHVGGALVKRIAKWCKDNLDFKLSNDVKTALGSVMRMATLKDQTFYFDIVTEFRWRRGNFGDHDSCFFGSGGGSRQDIPRAMEKEGKFAAIRFFKRLPNKMTCYKTDDSQDQNIYYADENYYHQGYSRAFMCFDAFNKKGTTYYKGFSTDASYPMTIIFNGYGYNTEQIGGIVSQFLGLSSKKIGLTNNKSTSGGLYVNSDGVLIGERSIIDTIKSYDFGVRWHEEKTIPSEIGFKADERLTDEVAQNIRDREHQKAKNERNYIATIKAKLEKLNPNYNPNIITKPIEGDNVIEDDIAVKEDGGLLQYIPDEPWGGWNEREREIINQMDRVLRIEPQRHWEFRVRPEA